MALACPGAANSLIVIVGRTKGGQEIGMESALHSRCNRAASCRLESFLLGLPRAQVALAWMLGKPFITSPIVGATKPHHLADAVAALALRLTPAEVASLEEPYEPHPVLGFS